MKFIKLATVILSAVMASSAWAHVGLTQSVPAENAMIMQSPAELTLTFSGDVRLVKVTLSASDKTAVDFGFTPTAAAAQKFSWPLPKLTPGHYIVNWVTLGSDGHKMTGNYSFMLHGNGAMQRDMSTEAQPTHSQHNH